MSVNETDGRRWVSSEVEVPGTPEEVWEAIASGPGISSWFVPTRFEPEGAATPTSVVVSFGEGMDSKSEIQSWDPPRRFVAEGSWGEGSPPVATEWSVEAREGGTCVVRVVHSLFASTTEWDEQLEGTTGGWANYFRVLKLRLTHFAGEPAAVAQAMFPLGADLDTVWDRVVAGLGLEAAEENWVSPEGAPQGEGIIEARLEHSVFLRLRSPGSMIVHLEALPMGEQGLLAWRQFAYGDGRSHADAQAAAWRDWTQALASA
ncbi:MAG: SRPBCC domain-containing protein [Myxococcota bacterium]